jgi:hypothetical protein
VGQRGKAQDAAAYSLVRNSLTALQAAFVDTGDYTKVTAADLKLIEPGINWIASDTDLVSTSPAWMSNTLTAQAHANEVAFYPQSSSVADLASISASGNFFGIQVDTVSISETGYVKVRVIDGSTGIGW